MFLLSQSAPGEKFTWQLSAKSLLFATVLNSRINIYARWDAWFIFNLRIKKEDQSHTCMLNCYNVIHESNSLIHTFFIHSSVA
jgi:hypothetical protein